MLTINRYNAFKAHPAALSCLKREEIITHWVELKKNNNTVVMAITDNNNGYVIDGQSDFFGVVFEKVNFPAGLDTKIKFAFMLTSAKHLAQTID